MHDTKEVFIVNVFVLVSGAFSVLSVFPLAYLALRSQREARDLRLIQSELADLMRDGKEISEHVRLLQREILREQDSAKRTIDETKRTVDQVTEVVEQTAEQVADAVADNDRNEPHLRRRLLTLITPRHRRPAAEVRRLPQPTSD